MGSDVSGNTGHFQPFYILDQILNRLRDINLVHLQGGWFIENLFGWINSIAQPQEETCRHLSIPPTRKYQSYDGPGMRELVNLLKGSDTLDADIATFMRASIVFWLLGATDGHGKNFSIFLGPGRALPNDTSLRCADRTAEPR